MESDVMIYKALGLPNPYYMEGTPRRLYMRIESKTIRPSDHMLYVSYLTQLGFLIDSITRKHIEFAMPVGWSHMRQVSTGFEIFFDEQGRERLTLDIINKMFYIRRQYDFIVSVLSNSEISEYPVASIDIVDSDRQLVDRLTMNELEVRAYMKTHSVADREGLMEAITNGMGVIMEEKFPDWTNPLLYWE